MDTFTWNTGRLYQSHGQVISAAYVEALGGCAFVDVSRGITGFVTSDRPEYRDGVQGIVMRAYDGGEKAGLEYHIPGDLRLAQEVEQALSRAAGEYAVAAELLALAQAEDATRAAEAAEEKAFAEFAKRHSRHRDGARIDMKRSASGRPVTAEVVGRRVSIQRDRQTGRVTACMIYRGREVKRDGTVGTIECYRYERLDGTPL